MKKEVYLKTKAVGISEDINIKKSYKRIPRKFKKKLKKELGEEGYKQWREETIITGITLKEQKRKSEEILKNIMK